MSFADYSLAKRLVQSTVIAPNGTHACKGNDVALHPISASEQKKNDADYQFSARVVHLDKGINTLESRASSAEVGWLDKEANTRKAELQHLYDYAGQHKIYIEPYKSEISSFDTRLRAIEAQLEYRAEQAEKEKLPWWRRAINFVVNAIGIVANFLGLAPLGGIIQGLISGGQQLKRLR